MVQTPEIEASRISREGGGTIRGWWYVGTLGGGFHDATVALELSLSGDSVVLGCWRAALAVVSDQRPHRTGVRRAPANATALSMTTPAAGELGSVHLTLAR